MYYGSKIMALIADCCEMKITTTQANQIFSIGLTAVVAGRSYIDWGDGSNYTEISTFVDLPIDSYSHTYTNIGSYVAVIAGKSNINSFRKKLKTGLVSIDITGMPLIQLHVYDTYDSVFGLITGMNLNYLYARN